MDKSDTRRCLQLILLMSLLVEETQAMSSYVATLSAGPLWATGGKTQTFYLQPNVEKTFSAVRTTTTLASAELFLGLQQNIRKRFYGQLGLAIVATDNLHLSGNIWDDADPEFNNYNYSYKVNHTHLALKVKLLHDIRAVTPYINASVGLGFNYAHRFNNNPTIFGGYAAPNFSPHTMFALTYSAGFGLQKTWSQHWQTGVGYEFADWGKSSLNRATGQTMGSGLTLQHLYTNGLMLNVTYLT